MTEIVRKVADLPTRGVTDHLWQFTLDFSTSQSEALTFEQRYHAPNSHGFV